MTEQIDRLPLFPLTAEVNSRGHLVIGGCDTVELVAEFGTPLYVFDEYQLRSKCTEFKTEFRQRYADTKINYSCKAFINRFLLTIINEEGLGLDVVSGGEIGIARLVAFPMDRIDFPGNNKSADEIKMALECGVGHIVVDNLHELKMLGEIAGKLGKVVDILLRISPGVDPHTHHKIITGNIDSKFGIPMVYAEEAVKTAMAIPEVNVLGLHFHIGSQIDNAEPFQQSIEYFINLAAEFRQKYLFEMKELSIGGGFAIQYTLDSPVPSIAAWAELLTSSIINKCWEKNIPLPKLIIEPGRSIVGQAGVALYTVGVIKDIPDVRTYVSVDGGMADNIRPSLYGAKLEAIAANKVKEKYDREVTIAGKYCESGDVLIKDISMPSLAAGDLVAVPGCGAYSIPESMNYNASFKPAIVMVSGGKARLIRRRETLEDLTRCDVL